MRATRLLLAVGLLAAPGCVTAANWYGSSAFLFTLKSEPHAPTRTTTPEIRGIQAVALQGATLHVTLVYGDDRAHCATYGIGGLPLAVLVEPSEVRAVDRFGYGDATYRDGDGLRVYLRKAPGQDATLEVRSPLNVVMAKLAVPIRRVRVLNGRFVRAMLLTPLTVALDAAFLPFEGLAFLFAVAATAAQGS